jgi:hypothetical protein
VDDDSWDLYAAPGLILLPTRQWSATLNPRLLARGLAAQWWMARTSPATSADLWLGVGLSRYSEALYMESAAGPVALEETLEDFTIGALVDESAAPIANAYQLAPFSPEFNSVVRDKGAMVFQMLRVVMGDEPFLRLLSAYSQRFRGRAATIDDFEKLAEEIHGQPLDYFFSEWLRSTGVPQFEMDWVIYRTQKGFRVGGQMKQQLEIFRMPIPIHIETEGPPTTQTVEVVGPRTDFPSRPSASRPRSRLTPTSPCSSTRRRSSCEWPSRGARASTSATSTSKRRVSTSGRWRSSATAPWPTTVWARRSSRSATTRPPPTLSAKR